MIAGWRISRSTAAADNSGGQGCYNAFGRLGRPLRLRARFRHRRFGLVPAATTWVLGHATKDEVAGRPPGGMADAADLKSAVVRRGGSSPPAGTNFFNELSGICFEIARWCQNSGVRGPPCGPDAAFLRPKLLGDHAARRVETIPSAATAVSRSLRGFMAPPFWIPERSCWLPG
jgi:hypothetical protein